MIQELRAEKAALLERAEQLTKRKQELYGTIDITQPMSEDEKQLDKQIAAIFSQIGEIVRKIRRQGQRIY